MHWHRLHGEVVESLSMEMFQNCGDLAPGDVVIGHGGMSWDWGTERSFLTLMIL